MSLDGTIFYGIGLGNSDSGELPWEDPDGEEPVEPEDWVAEKYGHKKPDIEYNDANRHVFLESWKAKRALLKSIGLEIGCGGTDAYTEYYVYVPGTSKSSDWGTPTKVLPLETDPAWRLLFESFCSRVGILFKEPTWYLTASWG